jgi:S-adenosylmethionine hydrolase
MAANRIITLTTDFGLDDPYVAAMKGVILDINPGAVVVDVSHAVRPQRLRQAVYLTGSAWPYFPKDAIHVVVVDPGVGTERRALAIETRRAVYIGPDSGVLSAALPDDVRPVSGCERVRLPDGCRVFSISNQRYMRPKVSATFHGRDVFAPVAAHLSLGARPAELGEPVDEMLAFAPFRALRRADGSLQGQVLHVDRFGNVITDVRGEDLSGGAFTIEIAGRSIPGPVRAYAEASGLAAVMGSGGYVEVALPNGNAAVELSVEIGDVAVVRPG